MSIDADRLNRADRRVLARDAQPARDLLIAKLGNRVYVGVAGGGRVRLRTSEARELAAVLLRLADT